VYDAEQTTPLFLDSSGGEGQPGAGDGLLLEKSKRIWRVRVVVGLVQFVVGEICVKKYHEILSTYTEQKSPGGGGREKKEERGT